MYPGNRGRRALGLMTVGALASTVLLGTPIASAVPGQSYAVTGTVTAEGAPFDGALLNFFSKSPDGTYSQYDATYPKAGAFEIRLPDGRYKLKVEDTTALRYESEWYDDRDSLASAEVIVVRDGAVRLVNIALGPPGITGVVRNAAGQAVSGVKVRAHDADLPEAGPQGSDVTDADGTFRVQPGPGDWKVEIVDTEGRYATEWYDDKISAGAAERVTLTDGDVPLGAVRVSRGGSISGRVTRPGGVTLRRVTVVAVDDNGDRLAFDRTNTAGDYTIARLAPGSYRLLFEDEFGGFNAEYYIDAAMLATAKPVPVGESQSVTGRNAVLEPIASTAPAGTDVTGVVQDKNGQPIPGVAVAAYDTPTNAAARESVDSDVTDGAGKYYLTGLDRDSLVASGAADPGETSFKLRFEDDGYGSANDELGFMDTWLGNQPTYEQGSTVPASGTAPGTIMREYAGVRGTLTTVDGAPDVGEVSVYDGDGQRLGVSEIGLDGSYEFKTLTPGKPYRFQFFAYGDTDYIPSWWRTGTNFATATPVTPGSGRFTEDISAVLTDKLTNLDPPTIDGSPTVGSTLQASPGRWNLETDADYTYEWLNGAAVVGTGPTYPVQVSDAGDQLRVRVTSRVRDLTGTADSEPLAIAKLASRTVLKGVNNATRNTVKLIARIVVSGVSNPGGRVHFKEGRKSLAKGVRVEDGRAVFLVRSVARGKHRYLAVYSGTPSAAKSRKSVTVRAR